jgi:hypothetical protein
MEAVRARKRNLTSDQPGYENLVKLTASGNDSQRRFLLHYQCE